MSTESNHIQQNHEILSWDTDLCKYLMQQWGEYLFVEKNIDETLNNSTPPFLTVTTATVELIFHTCQILDQPLPVYFLSVDVFDIFMRNHVHHLFERTTQSHKNEKGFLQCWKIIEERIENQLYLRILSSIQLASKIIFSGQSVTTSQIQKILENVNQKYNITNIIKSEIRVFKTIGFRIPLSTALDMVEQLMEACAIPMGLDPSQIYPVSVATLSLGYLQHTYIRTTYLQAASPEKQRELGKDFQRLLAGACLAAACRILNGDRTSRILSRHLSSHMSCAAPDITGLTDIIVLLSLQS